MMQQSRIEICGGIASGKTTLAEQLLRAGVPTHYEEFESNPFYQLFYQNPDRFSFETEVTFLLQHVGAIKISDTTRPAAFDFSLVLDLAYALSTLQQSDQLLFAQILRRSVVSVSLPDLIVRLRCPAETALGRIASRGRPTERSITSKYLETVEGNIDTALLTELFSDVRVIELDTVALDLRENDVGDMAVRQILSTIG